MPITDHSDPLALAIRPPPDESTDDKVLREQKQRNAKAVSDAIDASIKQERAVSFLSVNEQGIDDGIEGEEEFADKVVVAGSIRVW